MVRQMLFWRMAFILVLWWTVTGPHLAAQAVERYVLILKDGRRIAVSGYEIAGDQIFYERFDARIGIARASVETIIVVPETEDPLELEDVIVGRVLKAYNRSFTFGDFLREDDFAAEIEPRLTPEEQTAYVRKLISLKQWEILELEDQRQIAEKNGDVVDLRRLEQKLIAALRDLNDGKRALVRLKQRHQAGASPDDPGSQPSAPVASETLTSEERPANQAATEDSLEAQMDPSTGLDRLQRRRETLLLVIKKSYGAGEKTGGLRALEKARQELRIVDLQIEYFDHLAVRPTTSATPPPASP